jgi:hypothetical protein
MNSAMTTRCALIGSIWRPKALREACFRERRWPRGDSEFSKSERGISAEQRRYPEVFVTGTLTNSLCITRLDPGGTEPKWSGKGGVGLGMKER